MRLKDQVCIVTGAGRGIGHGIVLRFLTEGANVVALERDPAALAELRLTCATDKLLALQGDAADQATIDRTIAQTLARWDRIDVLVNNAVAYAEHGVTTTSDQDWADTIDSGLTSVFRWCRAALAPMLAQGRGVIINMASINQIVANPNLAAYTAAKGGVHALTKQIAVEYGPLGIRCNAISPGFIVTERTMVGRTAADLEWDAEAYPVGRVGQPADVAAAAAFLASEDAAFISGVDLPVDGGMTSVAPSALLSRKIRAWWGRKPVGLVD